MNDIYTLVVGRLFDITGNIISSYLSRTDWKEYEQMIDKVYGNKDKAVETNTNRIRIIDEIREGTACLACSKNHISTVSAALNEAMRFARSDGIKHPEVIRRIGIALDELNIMERIDLSSDKIHGMAGRDKELAVWILNNSRELRHMLDAVKTVEDLETAASYASTFRNEYLNRIFDTTDISKNKDKYLRDICNSLVGEEKERCKKAIFSL